MEYRKKRGGISGIQNGDSTGRTKGWNEERYRVVRNEGRMEGKKLTKEGGKRGRKEGRYESVKEEMKEGSS